MKSKAIPQRDPLLTVREAAQRCRLSVRQMWSIIKAKRLKVVRLGRTVRIEPAEVDRLIDGSCE
jgi:excisionase family DNA binding protein